LAANALVVGGGAGAAPATVTTGTGVLTALSNSVSGSSGIALVTQPQFTNTIGVGAAAAASGSGVTFAATQSQSSDVNTLDDYEEGTWTASFVAVGGGTIATSSQGSSYVKIGRLVTCVGYFNAGAVSSPSGDLRLSGLPFTTATDSNGSGSLQYNSFLTTNAFTSATFVGAPSVTYIILRGENNGNQVTTMAANVQNGSGIQFTFSYPTST
jgi:hypothetical protein